MYRYRVDYYVGKKIFGSTYADGWSRADAYHSTLHSELYKKVLAESARLDKDYMWDATRLDKP